MKRITIGIFALTAVLTVGVANAGSCPRHIKDIDAALAKSPVLSEENMSQIKALRDEGVTCISQGITPNPSRRCAKRRVCWAFEFSDRLAAF